MNVVLETIQLMPKEAQQTAQQANTMVQAADELGIPVVSVEAQGSGGRDGRSGRAQGQRGGTGKQSPERPVTAPAAPTGAMAEALRRAGLGS